MNYTPEMPSSQMLHARLGDLAKAANEVREAMMERLRNGGCAYPANHLDELGTWVIRLSSLEVDALRLKEEVE